MRAKRNPTAKTKNHGVVRAGLVKSLIFAASKAIKTKDSR
jgi:hypothetical protein